MATHEFDGRKGNGRPPIHGRYSKRLRAEALEDLYKEKYKSLGDIDLVDLAKEKIKELEVRIYRAEIMLKTGVYPEGHLYAGQEISKKDLESIADSIEHMESRSDKLNDSLHRYITVQPEDGDHQTPEQKEALYKLVKWVTSRHN